MPIAFEFLTLPFKGKWECRRAAQNLITRILAA